MKVYVFKHYEGGRNEFTHKIFSSPPKNKDVIDIIFKVTDMSEYVWSTYNREEDSIFQNWNFNEIYFEVEEYEVVELKCENNIHEKPLKDMKPGDSYQVKNNSGEILYTFGRAKGVDGDKEEYNLTKKENKAVLEALWSSVEVDNSIVDAGDKE